MVAAKFDQAEFGLSLYYYEQSLKVRQNLNPSGHVDMSAILYMIECCYEKQKNPKKALQFHQQALDIYEKSLPNDDGLRQKIVNSIHRLSIVK
ncbi:unnamed protein product [Rotaria socialis]|uniref:Tetratricopeptide repeat protein n=1 Tax=Rotaria socialis TaxID=392032 RepID=A0A818MTH1_9BILA|nr:unnamed protein product [Rotaria socialis]CAF4588063.1 unnamed protein product [Rotaria socialis]